VTLTTGCLLGKLIKLVFETGLEAEMDEHLGYQAHESAGRNSGNSRNGTRPKTVTTETGPLELEVPRDRNSTFKPQLVCKRQRRLAGVDDMVCSLVAKGLTTGKVSAHLAEVYGAQVSRDIVSRITDRVLEGMSEWQNRPLDPIYPVVFIDCIVVKIQPSYTVGLTAPTTHPERHEDGAGGGRVKGTGLGAWEAGMAGPASVQRSGATAVGRSTLPPEQRYF
jgi:transposase-like protein